MDRGPFNMVRVCGPVKHIEPLIVSPSLRKRWFSYRIQLHGGARSCSFFYFEVEELVGWVWWLVLCWGKLHVFLSSTLVSIFFREGSLINLLNWAFYIFYNSSCLFPSLVLCSIDQAIDLFFFKRLFFILGPNHGWAHALLCVVVWHFRCIPLFP